ncbi:MAG: transcriptional regulator [Aeromicrobium sp.]
MYSAQTRAAALKMLEAGAAVSAVSRATSVSRAAIRDWRDRPGHVGLTECPQCHSTALHDAAYSGLLGFYLGDGCISAAARCHVLRVSCDARLPRIMEEVERLINAVRPAGRVFRVRAPGVVVVQSNRVHWPCLFPQVGPGRKHERPIRLAAWQEDAVRANPAAFLRGLFHSDGSRSANSTRSPAGKRYVYPRWQFSNRSEDIHRMCQWALDLSGIQWTRSNRWTTSVSTRGGVARLDGLIGLKS